MRWRVALVVASILVIGVLPTISVRSAAPDRGGEPGRITIRWFVGLGATSSLQKERTKAFNRVVKEFNATNPDLKLVVDLEQGEVHDALAARIAKDRVPDVIGPATLRELSFAPSFADLEPLAQAAGFDLGRFDPGLLGAYRSDAGELVGLPFGAYPSVVYYNRDLFDAAGLAYPPTEPGATYALPDGTEAPWDLATLTEIATRLTIDVNGNDATNPAFDPTAVVQWGFHDQYGDLRRTLTFLGGADSLVSEGPAGPVVTIPDAWREAAGWYHEGIWQRHILPSQAQIDGPLLGGNPFASGHLGMAVAPLWYTCCIADPAGGRRSDWDVAVLPTGVTGAITSPLHADVLAIGRDSAHPDAAFRVLQYLVTDPHPRALWDVAPAATADRPAWYARMDGLYPGVTGWAAADAMLAYPDVPSHQSDLPDALAVQERLVRFRAALFSEAGAGMDIEAELDALQADLQAIVDQAP